MIISISGAKGSGKDTVGKIIQYLFWKKETNHNHSYEEYWKLKPGGYTGNWEIKKFAEKLKEIASLLTGVPREKWEDEEFKNLTFKDLYKQGLITEEFYNNLPDG